MVPIRENLLSKSKHDLKVPVESCAKDMKYIVVHNAAVDDKEIVVGIPLNRGAFAAGQRKSRP